MNATLISMYQNINNPQWISHTPNNGWLDNLSLYITDTTLEVQPTTGSRTGWWQAGNTTAQLQNVLQIHQQKTSFLEIVGTICKNLWTNNQKPTALLHRMQTNIYTVVSWKSNQATSHETHNTLRTAMMYLACPNSSMQSHSTIQSLLIPDMCTGIALVNTPRAHCS